MTQPTQRHRVTVNSAGIQRLHELAERTGLPRGVILDRAIELYWRAQLFEEAGRQWAAIQADPQARAELEGEYAVWDAVNADGLEHEVW